MSEPTSGQPQPQAKRRWAMLVGASAALSVLAYFGGDYIAKERQQASWQECEAALRTTVCYNGTDENGYALRAPCPPCPRP